MSAATINQPVAVPERVKRVMAMITRAAENRLPCPSNGDIADAIGASSVSAGANIINLLETMGVIAVERFGASRIITITSTGAVTAHAGSRKPHWRARGVKPVQHAKVVEPAPHSRSMSDDDIAARQVNRDPCPRCGVRADIGCRHGNAPLSMGAFA